MRATSRLAARHRQAARPAGRSRGRRAESGARAPSRRRATAAASSARRPRGRRGGQALGQLAWPARPRRPRAPPCGRAARARRRRARRPRRRGRSARPARPPPAGMSTSTSRVAGPATTMPSPSIHTMSAQPSGSTRSTWSPAPATCGPHAARVRRERRGRRPGTALRHQVALIALRPSRTRRLRLPVPRRALGAAGSTSACRNSPVWEPGVPATSSGVPAATTCAALLAALGAHVDDPVGGLDDVEVVLDDDDRVALVDEAVQDVEQALDVGEVQAGRRLVEDVERAPGGDLRQLGRELDALRLAARQRRRRLAEADVAEPDVVERLQAPADLRDVLEELDAPPRPACRARRRSSCP